MFVTTALLGVTIFFLLFIKNNKKSGVEDNKFEVVVKCFCNATGRFQIIWAVISGCFTGRSGCKLNKLFNPKNSKDGVVSFKLGSNGLAVVNNLKVAKEALKSADWSHRFPAGHYYHVPTSGKPMGLLFGGGEYFKSTHKIVQRSLHRIDFFNPLRMQKYILIEIEELVKYLGNQIGEHGKVLSPQHLFQSSTLNMVWQLMFAKRFHYNDPSFKKILEDSNEANKLFGAHSWPLDLFPILSTFYTPPFVRKIKELTNFLSQLFQVIIDEKKNEMSDHHEPRDFVDGFLYEMSKMDEEDSLVTESTLKIILRDLVFGGVDTTNTALEYTLLYVATNPRVYSKVKAEIDQVVGKSRLPTIDDRKKMIYTQATLLEVLRMGSVIPNTGRSNQDASQLNGFTLPAQTLITVKIYDIHQSQELWGDPQVFRPERFIGPDGSLMSQNNILPFGAGKRSCTGEPLARAIMFIFTVTLLQKFTFEIPPELPPPSLKTLQGLSRNPQRYFLRVTKNVC